LRHSRKFEDKQTQVQGEKSSVMKLMRTMTTRVKLMRTMLTTVKLMRTMTTTRTQALTMTMAKRLTRMMKTAERSGTSRGNTWLYLSTAHGWGQQISS